MFDEERRATAKAEVGSCPMGFREGKSGQCDTHGESGSRECGGRVRSGGRGARLCLTGYS